MNFKEYFIGFSLVLLLATNSRSEELIDLTQLKSNLDLLLTTRGEGVLKTTSNFESFIHSKEKNALKLSGFAKGIEVVRELGGQLRSKIVFKDLRREWRGGQKPYFAKDRSVLFDGFNVYQLYSTAMNFVNDSPGGEYMASVKPFDGVIPVSAFETGEGFSLMYQLRNKNGLLEELNRRIPGVAYRILPESDDDQLTIEFSANYSGQYKIEASGKIVLDLKHPGIVTSLVKEEILSYNGKKSTIRDVLKVSEIQRVGENFYIAKKADYSVWKNQKLVSKINFELDSAEFVIVDRHTFDIELPAGTTVQDQRFGLEYRVGDRPAKLVDNIKQYVNDD